MEQHHREPSHQHQFSKAGLHSAGPSTCGLRQDPAAPDFCTLLHRQFHQPSSCVALLPTPVKSILDPSQTFKMATVSCGPDSARTAVKRPFCSNFMPVIPAPAGSAMSSFKLVHKLVRQTSRQRRLRRNTNPNPARLVILRGPVLSMLVTVLTTLVGCVAGKFVADRDTPNVSQQGKIMHNCGPNPRHDIIVGSWPIKLT